MTIAEVLEKLYAAPEDQRAEIFCEWLEHETHEVNKSRLENWRKCLERYEISKAIMNGDYSGVMRGGKTWRLVFDDDHVDDWRDQYFNSEYDME